MAVVNVHQKRRAGDAPDPAGESYAQMVQSLDKLRWYYRFEEDAEGPFEATVGPDVLEVSPGPDFDPVSKVSSANGQLGEAITTAGYSALELPYVESSLPSGNSMSMGLWVKIPVGGGVVVIEEDWAETASNHSLVIGKPWGSEDLLIMHASGNGEYEDAYFPTGPNYLPHDTWAFFGFVFGPENWRLYLNGEKIGEQAVGAAVPVSDFVTYMAIELANGAVVDEVFATSTALTDQQWADLYAAATAN